ncbi:GNAT family N-acetyltransferase [Desulfonatronum thioautotrophicum]|uniref:GNAT family N-acetyltransferase n=1 Tax=Desulfonatronum thioautotrophicum TaxID=617001 RepID=UPI0005EB9C4B|nr:GNAT family N-acetyltransferase [Desulfonatronum thioautotrophicum]
MPTIRKISADDWPALQAMARRSFPAPQGRFIRPTEEGFMALVENTPAAAVFLRTFPLRDGRRVGYIAWLFTDPAFQGQGLAKSLIAASVARLEEVNCRHILTDIEGHNTASAYSFAGNGFRRIGFADQWRIVGPANLPRLWMRTVDPGHFIWMRDAIPVMPRPGLQRLSAFGLNWLFALIAVLFGSGLLSFNMALSQPSGLEALALLLGVVLVFGVREATMRMTAKAKGWPLEYRIWDSAFIFALPVAVLFGQLFPLPGGLYPRQDRWRYPDALPALGLAAVAGTASVMALVALALAVSGMQVGGFAQALAGALLFIGKPMLLFDSILAFPPFSCFNARRIFDLHRGLWAGFAVLGAILFLC